jgi:hypothetical protein
MRKLALTAVAVVLAVGCTVPTEAEPPAVQGGAEEAPSTASKRAPKKKTVPIKLQAKRAKANRSILSDGGALSCARVTVTNQTSKQLEVNPLYFSITDSTGLKHDTSSALAAYEGQIGTTELAPKERATGLVCAKGRFTPKVVAMTNPLFSETARAAVS